MRGFVSKVVPSTIATDCFFYWILFCEYFLARLITIYEHVVLLGVFVYVCVLLLLIDWLKLCWIRIHILISINERLLKRKLALPLLNFIQYGIWKKNIYIYINSFIYFDIGLTCIYNDIYHKLYIILYYVT